MLTFLFNHHNTGIFGLRLNITHVTTCFEVQPFDNVQSVYKKQLDALCNAMQRMFHQTFVILQISAIV